MIVFDFIFYALYLFYKRNEPKLESYTDSNRAFHVTLFLSALFLLRIMSLFPEELKKEIMIFVGLGLVVVCYFLFFYNKRYLKIEERFSKAENKKYYSYGYGVVVVYLVCTICLFWVTR